MLLRGVPRTRVCVTRIRQVQTMGSILRSRIPRLGGEMSHSIDDPRPPDVAAELSAYTAALAKVVPPKQGENLLIGTWNVRAFNRLTSEWRSAQGDSPLRDLSNVLCIAETLRRFDVVAIQEVGSSAEAFLAAMQSLGEGWAFLVTDVVLGNAGNHERLAFVFDRQRIRPSGLACELVVAAEDAGVSGAVLDRQFARTPYAVSFARGASVFTLVTLHVIYGNAPGDRVGELKEIAEWLADWARGGDEWGENLIALGDFNIDRQVDENGKVDKLYEAFTDSGLMPPPNLSLVPRTIFDDPDPAAPSDRRHYYDQIAWFTGAPGGPPALLLKYRNSGMFNFTGGLIPADTNEHLSFRMSDHFPLWCEFDMRP